jgi:hypothetical protein
MCFPRTLLHPNNQKLGCSNVSFECSTYSYDSGMKVTRTTTILLLVIAAAHQSNALDVTNPYGKRRMRTNAPDVFADSARTLLPHLRDSMPQPPNVP